MHTLPFLHHLPSVSLILPPFFAKAAATVATEEATDASHYGPTGKQLADLASFSSKDAGSRERVLMALFSRLTSPATRWRSLIKTLNAIEYLCALGDPDIVRLMRASEFQDAVEARERYTYVNSQGNDRGTAVRRRAVEAHGLLQDAERIREMRESAEVTKSRLSNGSGLQHGYGHGDGRPTASAATASLPRSAPISASAASGRSEGFDRDAVTISAFLGELAPSESRRTAAPSSFSRAEPPPGPPSNVSMIASSSDHPRDSEAPSRSSSRAGGSVNLPSDLRAGFNPARAGPVVGAIPLLPPPRARLPIPKIRGPAEEGASGSPFDRQAPIAASSASASYSSFPSTAAAGLQGPFSPHSADQWSPQQQHAQPWPGNQQPPALGPSNPLSGAGSHNVYNVSYQGSGDPYHAWPAAASSGGPAAAFSYAAPGPAASPYYPQARKPTRPPAHPNNVRI